MSSTSVAADASQHTQPASDVDCSGDEETPLSCCTTTAPGEMEAGILHNGLRRTLSLDHKYNGRPRQSAVRFISQATLMLESIHEQNRTNIQNHVAQGRTVGTVPEQAPGPAAATRGKPRLLLMGQRRSGKSSISSVVFHKMPPNETLFLESTARIQKDNMHSFMDFQVWDFPGQLDFLDPTFDAGSIFGSLGSLIWVIDAQDDYIDALSRLCQLILFLSTHHPSINIEVFIHKTDGLSDDYKFDLQRDIQQRVQDECSDMGLENINVGWYNTSIYNHSIFEAFSRVIQKLIPWLGWAEGLLNELCRACRFEKVYLFDVLSKIYIATDSSPVDMGCYEICSDYIDVVVDISSIYGWERPQHYIDELEGPPWNKKLDDQMGCRDAEATVVLKDGKRPIVLREVDKYLALVGVLREGGAEKLPMVKANVETTVRGLEKVFEVTRGKK